MVVVCLEGIVEEDGDPKLPADWKAMGWGVIVVNAWEPTSWRAGGKKRRRIRATLKEMCPWHSNAL